MFIPFATTSAPPKNIPPSLYAEDFGRKRFFSNTQNETNTVAKGAYLRRTECSQQCAEPRPHVRATIVPPARVYISLVWRVRASAVGRKHHMSARVRQTLI